MDPMSIDLVHVDLVMDKPVYGGDCLGHAADSPEKAGKAVFVPLTLPGERIRAQLSQDKRTFARAELDTVLSPSPHRIAAACRHFGVCGGCHYQHADYAAQLEMKQLILRETLSRSGVTVPDEIAVLSAQTEAWRYRNRIRLAFTSDGQIAYRGRRSHDLVAIAECPIAAPLLIEAAFRTARFIAENPAPVPLSEVELFVNHDESQLLLTLFTESTTALNRSSAEAWLESLAQALPPQAIGIRLERDDNSLAANVLGACGQNSLSYTAANFSYRVDHGAFFQVNRCLVDPFVELVTRGTQASSAWDLYAGVGLFARQLALNGMRVTAVEAAPASLDALRQNLDGAGEAVASTTLDYLRRNRELREPRPDLIVLDPPRAGLGDTVTQLLNAIHAPEMVYVSCDPATLARDLRQLTQERYRIHSITLVDMFPQTFHIETVVRLKRS
jgi:23S rRNA (uracil1939-C5)-methyltransferase